MKNKYKNLTKVLPLSNSKLKPNLPNIKTKNNSSYKKNPYSNNKHKGPTSNSLKSTKF